MRHIEKGVSTKEPRFISRALRALVTVRRKLNNNVLRKAFTGYHPAASTAKEPLLAYLGEVRITVPTYSVSLITKLMVCKTESPGQNSIGARNSILKVQITRGRNSMGPPKKYRAPRLSGQGARLTLELKQMTEIKYGYYMQYRILYTLPTDLTNE